jgi:hypothetical protein
MFSPFFLDVSSYWLIRSLCATDASHLSDGFLQQLQGAGALRSIGLVDLP